MNFDFSNIYSLIFGGSGNPAWWQCPIQQGVPYLLSLVWQLLIWVAGAAFLIGVLIAVFNYLTAFGDENKAKKGREALKWTFIGAGVVMLSGVLIMTIVNTVIGEESAGYNATFSEYISLQAGKNQLGKNGSCDSPATRAQQEIQQFDSVNDNTFKDFGTKPGAGTTGNSTANPFAP